MQTPHAASMSLNTGEGTLRNDVIVLAKGPSWGVQVAGMVKVT